MQPLDAQSALQVYGEASGWPMHNGLVQVYDPAGRGGTFDVDTVRTVFADRLPRLPVFRQLLRHAPGRLTRPMWVEAPEVDVAAHFTTVSVEAPGTDEQVGRLVGELMERPMDHTRPMWDGFVIEGLVEGRVALLFRTHHALVDGVRGIEVQRELFDDTPVEVPPTAHRVTAAGTGRRAGLLELAGASARDLAGSPTRAARTAWRLAAAARGRGAPDAGVVVVEPPPRAPRTILNRGITARREAAFCSIPLAGVKRFAREHGATVNDVVLTLVAGALRTYLLDRGELPPDPLVAAVPVGLRDEPGGGDAMGNRWQVINAAIGTDIADPVERLSQIMAGMEVEKARAAATDPSAWSDAVDIPPFVISAAAWWYARLGLFRLHPPASNVTVSNVRGTPGPIYLGGHRQVASYPLGPLADGMGVNITVIGYHEHLDFGIHVCPDVVAAPWDLVAGLREEAAALGPTPGTTAPPEV